MLDALVDDKAVAEPAGIETIVPPASTTVTPASTTGTFNNLASAASGSSPSSSFLGSLIKQQDAAAINKPITAIQDQTSTAILQQHQQVASKTMAALAVAAGGAFCYPKNVDDFHLAVENSDCTIVALSRQVGAGR